MEGMPGFMDHGVEVLLKTRSVHEDKGLSAALTLVLVSARGFALASLQVKAVPFTKAVEHGAKPLIHPVKDAAGSCDHFLGMFKRPQR